MLAIPRPYRILLLLGALAVTGLAYARFVAPRLQDWMIEGSRDAGFVLTDVSIEGMERTRRSDVLAVLDVEDGMPLLSIDLGRIQAGLEALSWVKAAEVTRVLPGGLKIRLVERQPYALWQENGKVRLIDPEGVVITSRGLGEFAHLMSVVGAGAEASVVPLQTMLEQTPELAAQVRTAVRVGERRWDILFSNGVRVKLPEDGQKPYGGEEAWQRFARLEGEHSLLAREVSVIDMRVPDRVIMRVSPEGRRRMDGKEWAT